MNLSQNPMLSFHKCLFSATKYQYKNYRTYWMEVLDEQLGIPQDCHFLAKIHFRQLQSQIVAFQVKEPSIPY